MFDGKLLGTMLKFAVPSALQQSIVTVDSVVVQATINGFGAAVIAGSAAAGRVVDLATAIPVNYGFALSSYVGQNIGANKLERIRPGLWGSILTCGAFSLVMTAIFELFPNQIVSLFVPKTEAALVDVLAVGSVYLRVIGAFCTGWVVAALVTIARYLQGGWREKSVVK